MLDQSSTYVEWSDGSVPWRHRYWCQAIPADANTMEQQHVPHGGVEIRWRRGEAPVIVGPTLHASVEDLGAGCDVVGIRFDPGHWPDIANCSVRDLVDRHLPLADVLARSVAADDDQPASDRGAALRETIRALRTGQGPAAHMVRTAELVRSTNSPIRDVAERVGWSERHARRHLRSSTGLSASELRRLGRFQRFVALVQHDVHTATRRSITDLAHAAGYADQSHLNRESRLLTGQTPKQYIDHTHHHCAGHHHQPSRARHIGTGDAVNSRSTTTRLSRRELTSLSAASVVEVPRAMPW